MIEGGSYAATDSSVIVMNADVATIYISIATNFNSYKDISANESERAAAYLQKANEKSYGAILNEHIAAYQKYFSRVKLDLGTTDASKLPTDQRLKNFTTANDPQLVTLYYQYGRYLLISLLKEAGSRPISRTFGIINFVRHGIASTQCRNELLAGRKDQPPRAVRTIFEKW